MSDNTNADSNMQILLFKKYNLLKNIGGGAFGTVFLGENVWTKEKVAIKIEERKNQKNSLEKEAYILFLLKGPGLPEIISFGKTKRYNILIETLLGRSLYQIYNECDKKFTIKDVCMLSIQMLERLEYIHSKNFIHRDIKPHNFLVSSKNESLIYLIDFGLAKKYRSDRGNHVKFALTKHITGTPRFCSINAMRGVEQSRRDDLESLSYLIMYFLKGSLPWQGLKIASRPQRFKEITRLKKTFKVESFAENIPPEIILFCKYVRKLGFTENPKYEYMKKLFLSVLSKYGFINDNKFSWISKINEINIENIRNLHLHKNSPHKRLIEKLRNSLHEKQKAKSREKDNNNDYTLTTIFMENNNNTSDISELNKRQNELGKKVLIQSNDNEIYVQNNLIQLNIENSKHSYNYPLVIYQNNLSKKNQDNNFNKIAQTFQSNDSNVLKQNKINIPDKISMINVTGSNLVNMQFSANQELFIPEKETEINKNQNKTIKIHDYIRQEEKEGGVIDKDFDYRENDYFKINKPVFPPEQIEQENEINKNKLTIPIEIANKKNENNIVKSKTYISHNNIGHSYRNKSNIKKIGNNVIKNINNNNKNNNEVKKSNKNMVISFNDNENTKINKCPSPKNQEIKFNSFFIKKVSINLNKNIKMNNTSPKNINPKNNDNNYNTNKTAKKEMKCFKINQLKKQSKNIQDATQEQIKNINSSYEMQSPNMINSNININNHKNFQTDINYNINKDKLNVNNKRSNPQYRINKINNEVVNSIKNSSINSNNYKKENNFIKINLNVKQKNQINSNSNELININNSNRLRNNQNNNILHMINDNNSNNNEYTQNKSYQIQNNYQRMNLNLNPFKQLNNNPNNNQKKNQNHKNNNIIINNLIIKNNCNNLFYKNNSNKNSNQNKNQNRKNIDLRNSINTTGQQIYSSNVQYKSILQRYNLQNGNNILTSPK